MKMKKFMVIASVVCMSLSGLVACSSDKSAEVNVDESNLSEEEKKFSEASALYESGNDKLKSEDYQGALNDFIDAIALLDEIDQTNESEEYASLRAELELALEEAGSNVKNAE